MFLAKATLKKAYSYNLKRHFRMELIIHTGHGKTGTSSIQLTLKKNLKLLRKTN